MASGILIKEQLTGILQQVSQAYLDGNLQLQANSIISAATFAAQASSDADDEDENFEKGQRTQKSDDLDAFAKLMRIQIVPSLKLILSRL